MTRLRVSAGAYLYDGGKVLLMKRSPNKDIAPGLWAGIGGHLEHSELNDPTAACLREIEEETGIRPYDIQGLRLRYIVHSKRPEEIHLQYHFFGIYEGVETLRKTVSLTLKCHYLFIVYSSIIAKSANIQTIYM